jgi:predicted amidophosphoribosyltransferase
MQTDTHWIKPWLRFFRQCYMCARGSDLGSDANSPICGRCENYIKELILAQQRLQDGFGHFYLFEVETSLADPLYRVLIDLKDHGRGRVVGYIAQLMVENFLIKGHRKPRPGTLLVAAPSTSGRRHARNLAGHLAHLLDLPLQTSPTEQWEREISSITRKLQKKLTKVERRRRSLPPVPVSGSVILVDDVLTTGATARSCFEALGRPPGFQVWTPFFVPGPGSNLGPTVGRKYGPPGLPP